MAAAVTSIARRVSLTGVVVLAVVLLVVTGIVSGMLTRSAHQRVHTWVGDKSQSMVDAMNAMDDTSRILVERNFGSFRQEFGPTFALDEATGELRDWGPKLNGNFTQVDKFAGTTGGVATVFAAKDGDFERITTSVKKADGTRAIGTKLGTTHPAFATLKAGKSYAGRAVLFGRAYMSYYEPIKNDAGKLIGLLYVGFDLDAFEKAMDKMAADAKFFQHGGTYIIGGAKNPETAFFAAHPTAKGKLLKDAAPTLLTALAGADKDSGYVSGAPDVLGNGRDDNFAIVRKNEQSGYWVVAQVSEGEAMASHWGAMLPFWAMLALTTAGLGAGLFWMMRSWVARPLGQLTEAVAAIAEGDLTHAVHSDRKDEIGLLMRNTESMRRRLADTIGTVRHSVDSIGTASTEIATGNQDLSQRTEQTASNLQITASSMTQLTVTVKQTADSARTANQLVSTASSAAAKGGEVVGQVVSTMDEINTSSRKISDIIGVIDGIAFQTNILALNAAVEAARAGEQGRGFAVVASEVRSLAQRSAEAAKEIKTLIGASVERVETGARLVQDAGSSMNEIVSSVQRVQDIIGEISAAASEQSDGIGQVNSSVGQLDQMTQQNAALVEQSAAAAESLKEQAQRLVQAVAVFRVAPNSALPSAAAVVASAPVAASPRPTAAPAAPQQAAAARAKPAAKASRPATAPKPAAAPAPAPAQPVPASAAADGEWESF
jgi:methyl-accepting chemotaxis protein-2 (aspartate sensor receptor)